ncbi:MAG: hypothetical protein ABSF47_01995 [Minisyncoccia bacterium]|jgi:hypothetical protein
MVLFNQKLLELNINQFKDTAMNTGLDLQVLGPAGLKTLRKAPQIQGFSYPLTLLFLRRLKKLLEDKTLFEKEAGMRGEKLLLKPEGSALIANLSRMLFGMDILSGVMRGYGGDFCFNGDEPRMSFTEVEYVAEAAEKILALFSSEALKDA